MISNTILLEFLLRNDILLVDRNSSSKSRLVTILCDLGIDRKKIHTTVSVDEAIRVFSFYDIGLVFCDYFISGGSGFDLIKLMRQKSPKEKDLCLFLVTSNVSQSVVARAAEEDVDSFILKPFSIKAIEDTIISTVCSKVNPAPYVLKLREGKGHLENGKHLIAIGEFTKATKMNVKPSLAFYYKGQVEVRQNETVLALSSYNRGLSYSPIHFKCLRGLCEVLLRNREWDRAYGVAKKIVKFYPANPERLMDVIRLAIKTENFQDIIELYIIFSGLDQRPAALVNYIGSGLYVAGKYFLLQGDLEKAYFCFDSIAESCSEFPKFIKAVIFLLKEKGHGDYASQYLNRDSLYSNSKDLSLSSGSKDHVAIEG